MLDRDLFAGSGKRLSTPMRSLGKTPTKRWRFFGRTDHRRHHPSHSHRKRRRQMPGFGAHPEFGQPRLLKRHQCQFSLRVRMRKGILQRWLQTTGLQNGIQQPRKRNLLRSGGGLDAAIATEMSRYVQSMGKWHVSSVKIILSKHKQYKKL